jgi:hypothetical protein
MAAATTVVTAASGVAAATAMAAARSEHRRSETFYMGKKLKEGLFSSNLRVAGRDKQSVVS